MHKIYTVAGVGIYGNSHSEREGEDSSPALRDGGRVPSSYVRGSSDFCREKGRLYRLLPVEGATQAPVIEG
jgi:hypothetical protein